MGRAPCCDKAAVKKGSWSPEEDAKLRAYIEENGTGGNWIALPHKIGLKRCGKSCRLRWLNYLRPNIKHGDFSEEEDLLICSLFVSIGSRWSVIAAQLPGRTDNDVKNYWNTKLKKKLLGKTRDHHGEHEGPAPPPSPPPSQHSTAGSALERMQLYAKLRSLYRYPSFSGSTDYYPAVAAAQTAAPHRTIVNPAEDRSARDDDLAGASGAASRLGLPFPSMSSTTVSSEGIGVINNDGSVFDGGMNWDESLDSWGSGAEISSSSSAAAWDLSAVFQAADDTNYSMLQDDDDDYYYYFYY